MLSASLVEASDDHNVSLDDDDDDVVVVDIVDL